MFNQVLMFEAQPIRVWSVAGMGRYAIFPDGLMRWFPAAKLAMMPRAIGAERAHAFPVQDQMERI